MYFAPMKAISLFFLLFVCYAVRSQIPDHIYYSPVHSVKLYRNGDIYSYPILTLNGVDRLDLHFDDFDAEFFHALREFARRRWQRPALGRGPYGSAKRVKQQRYVVLLDRCLLRAV